MKFLATFFCLFFLTLTVTPTVRVIKMHFAQNCQSSCQKNNSDKSGMPSGCKKDRCVLNLNFTPSQFIVSKVQYEFIRNSFEIEKQQIVSYQKRITSNHNDTIWQPPKRQS